jgi:hypothetical protein
MTGSDGRNVRMADDDWKPPPGMVKRRCESCGHDFATRGFTAICPDCKAGSGRRKAMISASPFDQVGTGHRINPKGSVRS